MNQPLFTIITTTHKRPDLLMRATKSVLAQSVSRWKMIIVNDSPEHDYSAFEQKYLNHDSRIRYIKNTENIGKNASVNHALEILRQEMFEGYIIFLDDDDWLARDCLETFQSTIINHTPQWLVSKRSTVSGREFTLNKTQKNYIHYTRDMLLLRRFYGDTTQCIHFPSTYTCRFSELIHNGEEWLYYSQVARISPVFLFIDKTGTYSDGYQETGLTKQRLTHRMALNRWVLLWKEVISKKILTFDIGVYMILRLCKVHLDLIQQK